MENPSVAIIDYDIGNLFSVKKACEIVGLDAFITNDSSKVKKADAVILPGVGAFGDAMNNLKKFGLDEEIIAFVKTGKFLMGVCLGMQLLMSKSEEFGEQTGLCLVDGTCKRFPNSSELYSKIRVPQVTWNDIYTTDNSPFFLGKHPLNGLKNKTKMYFVHSYYVIPTKTKEVLSETEYFGIRYCSSIIKDNIFAFQFHPEKSGATAIHIYDNFKNIIFNNKK